jgi:hypothetical protein
MSNVLWRSGWAKKQKRDRKRAKQKARANYRVHYNVAYDGGGSEFDEYYKTKLGARIATFFHLHVRSWGGSAELYPHPMPIPARHMKGKK